MLACWSCLPTLGRPLVPLATTIASHQHLLLDTVSAAAFSPERWCFAEDPDLDIFRLRPGMDGMVSGAVRRGQVRMWLLTVQTLG